MITRPVSLLSCLALIGALGACPSDDGGGGGGGGDASGDTPGGGCAKAAPGDATCNPYCQTGCAAGENCTFDGTGWTCVLAGAAGLGETCGGPGACQVSMACFQVDGEAESACRQVCLDDAGCPDGRRCNTQVDFGDGPVTFCGAPPVGCDPFADPTAACGDGQACYLDVNAGTTACAAAGSKAAGEVCWGEAANTCQAGLQCVVQCAEVCSTNAGTGGPSCDACAGDHDVLSEDNGVGACVPDAPRAACELFEQTGCAGGEMCALVRGGIACIPAGSAAAGASCTFANDCAPGTVCAGGTCRTVCDASAGAATVPCDTTCANGHDNLIPQAWEIGACKL